MSRRRASDKEHRAPGQRQLRVGERDSPSAGRSPRARQHARSRLREASITVTSVDISRTCATPRPSSCRWWRRQGAAAGRAAPRGAVVPRPRQREGGSAQCPRDPFRDRPHLRRGRQDRRPAAPARRGPRTSRTIEVVIVAREQVRVGRRCVGTLPPSFSTSIFLSSNHSSSSALSMRAAARCAATSGLANRAAILSRL